MQKSISVFLFVLSNKTGDFCPFLLKINKSAVYLYNYFNENSDFLVELVTNDTYTMGTIL